MDRAMKSLSVQLRRRTYTIIKLVTNHAMKSPSYYLEVLTEILRSVTHHAVKVTVLTLACKVNYKFFSENSLSLQFPGRAYISERFKIHTQ